MKNKPKTFPTEIFVTSENEGTEDAYKMVHESPSKASEMGVKKNVAKYRLDSVFTVEGIAKITQ